MTSAIYRVFAKVLDTRLREALLPGGAIPPWQFGFQAECSTAGIPVVFRLLLKQVVRARGRIEQLVFACDYYKMRDMAPR